MVTGTSDISMDFGCSEVMDPDRTLSCSSGLDVAMSLSSSVGQLNMDVSWSSDSNLDSGDWFDPGLLDGNHWQPESCMSIWILAATGPRTQAWPLVAAWAQMIPWPQVIAKAT